MKVKYIIDNIEVKKSLSEYQKREPEEYYAEYLELGKEYVVYGIHYCDDGEIRFLTADGGTPDFYPSSFFEVTDNRISKYWVGTTEKQYPLQHPKIPSFISIKEINDDGWFFDNLLDDERPEHEETVELYWKYVRLMDEEFEDSEDDDFV